jgi:hypothetical protein
MPMTCRIVFGSSTARSMNAASAREIVKAAAEDSDRMRFGTTGLWPVHQSRRTDDGPMPLPLAKRVLHPRDIRVALPERRLRLPRQHMAGGLERPAIGRVLGGHRRAVM